MNNFIKRTFDLLSSVVLFVLLIPLWIIVPVLIKIDSKGPIFFVQRRRTKNGKVFNMYKFRSMVVNAESMSTGLFSFKEDTRITKIGAFLRKSSIDEIPQLLNIIKGEMSIIGPRPCVEYELGDYETLNRKYKKRFQMKAGLTGLAQAKYRNEITWDKKVEIDNEYIDLYKTYGILIDIKILFMTINRVINRSDIVEKKIDISLDDGKAAELAQKEIVRLAHMPENGE